MLSVGKKYSILAALDIVGLGRRLLIQYYRHLTLLEWENEVQKQVHYLLIRLIMR